MNQQFTLNQEDLKRWFKNLLLFFAPVVILYIIPLIGLLSLPTHIISLTDFIPTRMVVGAMVLYVLNGILDLIRKFVSQ